MQVMLLLTLVVKKWPSYVPSGFRDTLDLLDLCFLQAAEQVCRAAIKEGMERKFPYKEIYLLAKERVTKYAETVAFARIEKK